MTSFISASAFLTGIGLGSGSILSIGPNNLMLLREGITKGRVLFVAGLILISQGAMLVVACLAADWLSQMTGTARTLLTFLGIVALGTFAILSFRAATYASARTSVAVSALSARSVCLRRCLATVWLNPLTYVEYLFIPAAICAGYRAGLSRVEFIVALSSMAAIGAGVYSLGGRLCSPLVRSPRALRAFDLTSGALLASVAVAMAAKSLLV